MNLHAVLDAILVVSYVVGTVVPQVVQLVMHVHVADRRVGVSVVVVAAQH